MRNLLSTNNGENQSILATHTGFQYLNLVGRKARSHWQFFRRHVKFCAGHKVSACAKRKGERFVGVKTLNLCDDVGFNLSTLTFTFIFV